MSEERPDKDKPIEWSWNWGAFFFNWIWGLFNGSKIALLTLVPGLNLIMPFVLGAKGNEWAWKNKQWDSYEQFRATQKRWSIAALFLVISVLFSSGAMILYIEFQVKNEKLFSKSLALVTSNSSCMEKLGAPISEGFGFTGIIERDRTADLSYPINGTKTGANVHLKAEKINGKWLFQTLFVEIPNQADCEGLQE